MSYSLKEWTHLATGEKEMLRTEDFRWVALFGPIRRVYVDEDSEAWKIGVTS